MRKWPRLILGLEALWIEVGFASVLLLAIQYLLSTHERPRAKRGHERGDHRQSSIRANSQSRSLSNSRRLWPPILPGSIETCIRYACAQRTPVAALTSSNRAAARAETPIPRTAKPNPQIQR